MSDYNPNDPLNRRYNNAYDKYGNAQFEPADAGKGPYVLLGILVLIGLVGGLLYFNGTPKDSQQAQMPDRTMGAPATPGPKAVPRTVPDTPKAAEPSQASPSDNNAPIKQ